VDGDVCAFQREIDSVGFPIEHSASPGRTVERIEHRRWGVGRDDEHEVTYQVLPAAQ
jgi:hypothetical protein